MLKEIAKHLYGKPTITGEDVARLIQEVEKENERMLEEARAIAIRAISVYDVNFTEFEEDSDEIRQLDVRRTINDGLNRTTDATRRIKSRT